MLSFDDPRWSQLKGGYRVLYDPRPALTKVETNDDSTAAWHELWDELHHQGDVDEASYASVPHLVRIYHQRGVTDWNTYAIVAVIELAREEQKNPKLPSWLEDSYFHAIRELAEMGMKELPGVENVEVIGCILSILALQKGARTYARFLVEYSEQELLDIESAALEA